MKSNDDVWKVVIPPGVVTYLCESCRKREGKYEILSKDIDEECQSPFHKDKP